MKKTIFLLASLAFAQTTTAPRPIAPADQEAVSRRMLTLQREQLLLAAARDRESQAEAQYGAYIDTLRKQYGAAENCDVTIEKEWKCDIMGAAK
jgi:hypothetical protein